MSDARSQGWEGLSCGKTPLSPWRSRHCHTHSTSDSRHCGVFPHQAVLSSTSWVSYSLSYFWHRLPRDYIRHTIRAQSHKTAPGPRLMPMASAGGSPVLLMGCKSEVRFICQSAHRTQGNTTSGWSRGQGWVPEGMGYISFPVWMCLPAWKFSEPQTAGILRRLPQLLLSWETPPLSAPPRSLEGGAGLKDLSFQCWLGFSVTLQLSGAIQEPMWRCLVRTKDASRALFI